MTIWCDSMCFCLEVVAIETSRNVWLLKTGIIYLNQNKEHQMFSYANFQVDN